MTATKNANALSDYRKAGNDPMSSENQRILGKLVEREVVYCVSSLIHHFATNENALDGSDYTQDDLYPILTQDDYAEPAEDYIRSMIADDCIEYLDTLSEKYGSDIESLRADVLAAATANIARLINFCEYRSIEPHRIEAYEHWAVTEWFMARLAEHGEMTGELFDLNIWGRATTGQSISIDHVIQQIAAEMEILTGQANAWKD